MDCGDGDSCTDDACVNGACTHTQNAAPCDDGDSCTENDVCVGGVCGGVPITGCCSTDADCDDGDSCTDDACSGGVCTNDHNTADCDDGDPCTVEDVCRGGTCVGIPLDQGPAKRHEQTAPRPPSSSVTLPPRFLPARGAAVTGRPLDTPRATPRTAHTRALARRAEVCRQETPRCALLRVHAGV